MADILVVSDAPWVRREVIAALDDDTIREVETGDAVPPAVRERRPDLVITDLQVGSMGGMAIALELRLEESGGRLPHVPVLMLCDRIRRLLGDSVVSALEKLMGLVLTAIAVEMVLAGLKRYFFGPA